MMEMDGLVSAAAGGKPLVTLNLYCPPAFTAGGDVKRSVAKP